MNLFVTTTKNGVISAFRMYLETEISIVGAPVNHIVADKFLLTIECKGTESNSKQLAQTVNFHPKSGYKNSVFAQNKIVKRRVFPDWQHQ